MQTVLFFSHIGLTAGLFFACFCKMTKTDETTSVILRFSVFVEAVTSLALFFAVVSWGMEPNIWVIAFMASTLFYSYITRKVWEYGYPIWAKKMGKQLALF